MGTHPTYLANLCLFLLSLDCSNRRLALKLAQIHLCLDATLNSQTEKLSFGPLEMLSATDIRQWLSQAHQFGIDDAQYQRGILMLEHLLAVLTPQETFLLPNYPNPFNPETWIPYQLAAPADVVVQIYTVNGVLVRTLALGHRSAGIYQEKSHAAYWDGKNEQGETVSSGVYFYTLKVGDFSATKKMLIRK